MLSFRIGTLPIAIRPSFLLTALLLGFLSFRQPASLVIWVVVVFVSVLAHELGHAVTARRYGATVEVELFALGGVTKWHREPAVPAGGRVLIAAAGSAIGITIGLAVLLLTAERIRRDAFSPLVEQALVDIIFVNLGWGILNWLPIRMLDGGHILAGLLEIWFPRRHEVISDRVFLAVAVVLIGLALWFRQWWLAFLFALFGFSPQSSRSRTQRDEVLRPRLEHAKRALAEGDFAAASAESRSLLPKLRSHAFRAEASSLLIRALLAQDDVAEAEALLADPPSGFALGPTEAGIVALAGGRLKSAIESLSEALRAGHRDALAPLAAAYGRAGAFTEAAALLEDCPPEVLDRDPIITLAAEADRTGWSSDAARLRRLASGLSAPGGQPPSGHAS